MITLHLIIQVFTEAHPADGSSQILQRVSAVCKHGFLDTGVQGGFPPGQVFPISPCNDPLVRGSPFPSASVISAGLGHPGSALPRAHHWGAPIPGVPNDGSPCGLRMSKRRSPQSIAARPCSRPHVRTVNAACLYRRSFCPPAFGSR